MCDACGCGPAKKTTDCEKPENLESKPEECSSEQVKECHGETKQHPCES